MVKTAYVMPTYSTFSRYGFTSLLLAVGGIVLANGFAYALASALNLNYGRLIAGLTLLFLAFIFSTEEYEGVRLIAYVGFVETLIGLFDILACKVGSPYWIAFDPNKSPTGS